MTRLILGDTGVVGLMDIEQFDIPLTTLFPDADPAALERPPRWLAPSAYSDRTLHLKIRSWLLRRNGRTILVDTCVGADKERPHWPAWHRRDGASWLVALAAEGLRPEDIDIVFCTHLHADHVGWNTRLIDGRWVPTFPNARYIVSRQEYQYWEAAAATADRHGAFADSVTPVMEAGRMDLVDDGWDLARGLTLLAAPGHTPGHTCLHVTGGPGAVFCGDVVHSPVQLAHPDWSSAFCSDPDLARRTRKALLDDLADSERFLVPGHFDAPGWRRVRRDGAAYRPAS